MSSRTLKGLTVLGLALGAVTCGVTDTAIVSVDGQADTLVVSGSVDTTTITATDTVVGPPDTVLITSTDTVVGPPDTVVVETVDTVVAGTDTTIVMTVDTVVTQDTVVVLRVDTVVTVDTVVVVDTVDVTTELVASLSTLSLRVGQTATLSVTTQTALGIPQVPEDVTWVSDNEDVATVSPAGVVRGEAVGSTLIFAVVEGLSATIPTTVTSATTNPPPPPDGTDAEFVFYSDWSTATGTSSAAILDADKPRSWTGTYGTRPEVMRTSAEGRDFPTTNFLRVFNTANGVDYFPGGQGPAIGESVYFRMYYREIVSGTTDDKHGIYFDDSTQSPNWGPNILGFYHPGSSGFPFWISLGSDAISQGDPRYFSGPNLSRNVTYRIETAVHRTGTSTFEVDARIYDVNGTRLYETKNFRSTSGFAWQSGVTLSGYRFTTSDPDRFRSLTGLRMTLEEGSGSGGAFYDVAAVAICRDDWCGPYANGR